MAIKFDLFENPVKEGVSSSKLHAKVITKDVVTTREIRESISKKCTVAPADVADVSEKRLHLFSYPPVRLIHTVRKALFFSIQLS